ncbi:MAG TPA: FAD-dependent oxidoreductase [Candidatus Saccharimonadales bacterium]|nr:FAD-dependent oxidoreductase [Candidatus Saccharimonadales bacterium]
MALTFRNNYTWEIMHTVIVGGGFAGVRTALELSKKQLGKITLISDEPYFLYHASLYATATGRDTSASRINLEDIFAAHHDIEVIQDRMMSIDSHRRIVIGKAKQYTYDELVIAIGVVTTYFGITGMQAHSYGIKTLDEAKVFKRHLHDQVAEDRHMDKNYVVIGGGLTGVELAGAMARYLREIAKAHAVTRAKVNITLVEAAPRLVPRLSETASKIIQKRLESLGVQVKTNHKVEALDDDTIAIDGRIIPTETAVWTSGVMNHPFFSEHPDQFTLAKNGRVEVDTFLRAQNHIYVIGDNANTAHTGTARTALYDAYFIADHLARKATRRTTPQYRPHKYADNIPVGDHWAYVEKYGIYAAGRIGHYLRRRIELSALRSLLPRNQALSMWHALYEQEEEPCDVCRQGVSK